METKKYKITNCVGLTCEVTPELFLYSVKDYMGRDMTIPGIQLYTEEEGGRMPFATLTKSFGEFIGAKNTAYIDINNCDFAEQLLQYGFAKNAGFTKQSGFCTYPLWVFDDAFLREIGSKKYEEYSDAYDAYMAAAHGGEDDV